MKWILLFALTMAVAIESGSSSSLKDRKQLDMKAFQDALKKFPLRYPSLPIQNAPKSPKSYTEDPGFPLNVALCILSIPLSNGIPPFCEKPSRSLDGAQGTPKEYAECALARLLGEHLPSFCESRFPEVQPQKRDPGFPLNSLYHMIAEINKVGHPLYLSKN